MTYAPSEQQLPEVLPGPARAPAPPRRATQSSSLTAEFRAGRMVWRREMIHFFRDRTRMVVSLLQPLLFLYILGIGLSRLFHGAGAPADYLLFLFPGVLVMAAQTPAITVGASIVWDRESGFLREMLVAPVRRSTLLIGKCLGGATVATVQSAVVLATAGLIGIPYRIDLIATLLAELLLAALSMTVMATVVAVTIRRMQTFNTVMTVTSAPMLFLSGLMFPINVMPRWMALLTMLNPLTYAVSAMRQTIGLFSPGRASAHESAAVTWNGWPVPLLVALALVAAFTLVGLVLASRKFSRNG